MRRPRMVLFDYGHTLAWTPGEDYLRGEEAVFRYVAENPRGVTPQEAARLGTAIWLGQREIRHSGAELSALQQLRLKYDVLGLRFTRPLEVLEQVLWTAVSPGEAMPGAPEMLAALQARGIRTGVISNLGWSAAALTGRLERLTGHRFEFVMTSSEYGVRKPDPMIFRAALGRSGLDAGDVWYCGDELAADVRGARGAGIHPVWYRCAEIPNAFDYKNDGLTPEGPCLCISRWAELVQAIDDCEE